MNFNTTPINISGAGDHNIVENGANRDIGIFEIFIWSPLGDTIQFFRDNQALSGPLPSFPAASGALFPDTGNPRFVIGSMQDFVIRLTTGNQLTGWCNWKPIEER